MATKKTYGTARKFTEGHLEVLGDQSEVSNPSPPAEDPKMLASYAKQRAYNAQPWSVRKGNQIHGEDPNMDFKTRLSNWETKKANQGNNIHGPGPKPVDLGRDRGGNWYKKSTYQMQGNSALRGPQGNTAENRVNQEIWRDGRDGSPLTKKDRLLDKRKDGELTRREKADQYSAQQPLARNELQEGIQGNFGTLGNFFNKDD
jgi:hypothetical protein|tara:strand:+ start:74 stop:679 length:606 start_codon:yes stop_codon:yes gene_type:complete